MHLGCGARPLSAAAAFHPPQGSEYICNRAPVLPEVPLATDQYGHREREALTRNNFLSEQVVTEIRLLFAVNVLAVKMFLLLTIPSPYPSA